MPSDWDAEEDGDWTAPVIANPEYAAVQDYSEGRDEEGMLAFLNRVAGTNRKTGGGLDPMQGRSAALDVLVSKFFKAASGKARSDVADEVKSSTADNAKFYGKMLDKVQTAGPDAAVDAERTRLGKLINSGQVKASQLVKFEEKLNILHAFEEANSGE